MEKKTSPILIITLIIFILATICLSSYIVYDKFIKKEENTVVKSDIKEEQPTTEVENKEELSDDDIIDIGVAKFQQYVNMSNTYYAGSPEKLLTDLSLINSDELQNLNENDNFLQTNIKWNDFKNEILKYISERLFNKNESNYYLNDNGNLKFLGAGKGGATFTVLNSKLLGKNSNSYTILVDGNESWITESTTKSYKFEIINENNNWVIDNINSD